jgi:phosphoserine phosphatase RsbU/P
MKILIAEDDLASQRLLKATLEKLGHQVTAVADGEAAWRSLILATPEVIVSDWMMPELDGVELCKRVRGRRQKRYTYFILLTARSARENYLEAMDAGVDDFLSKPLKADELSIRLRVAARILSFIGQLGDLKRLLPICSYCHRVRDDKQFWQDIQTYLRKHNLTDFSHGICPECYDKHVKPQLGAGDETASPEGAPEKAG